MILKDYQQKVLEDLEKFLELFKINQSASKAYEKLWKDHGNIEIGRVKSTNDKFLLPPYQDFFDGKPSVCLKVPTGGGKTFIACNSLKIIFDELSINKNRVVVWLVPSETILNQTLKALNDPTHPYRKQINEDFFSDVAIYTKEQLLNGQNFTPSIVEDQLSIMVLSYDSFRGRSNDFLRSKQSNANLSAFNVGKIENPIEGVDNDSLIQTINRLKPVIIVDESHHAKSPLSIKMLKNFNPRFVLELTATPHKDSNLISFVTASTLKDSNMVKLPVIIFKTSSVERVIADSIHHRNRLEKLANEERQRGGRYIRPIVLFQAQPKNSDEQITFKNLRERLINDFKIPTDQIAIRTAEIDELKNKNLLSEECPIRYIITINALHEGWDCPFAYILASVANRNSEIEVEQILGRILRQPYTMKNSFESLNRSYVLTSSIDFNGTINNIVAALNSEGFSEKDCRVIENELQLKQMDIDLDSTNSVSVKDNNNSESKLETVKATIRKEFWDEVKNISIPQFFYKIEAGEIISNGQASMFDDTIFLEKDNLSKGFSLKDYPAKIDFNGIDLNIIKVDRSGDKVEKQYIEKDDIMDLRKIYTDEEERLNAVKDFIFMQLRKSFKNNISYDDLDDYINEVFAEMNPQHLNDMQFAPPAYFYRIKKHIDNLMTTHAKKIFSKEIDTGKIICQDNYKIKQTIELLNAEKDMKHSLYDIEGKMNNLEINFALRLTGVENIKWWHRNIVGDDGFNINGFINHYPDFMMMTNSGRIIFVETKGDYLDNEDTAQKIQLGNEWKRKAGDNYRYYMIFENLPNENYLEGVMNVDKFINYIENEKL